MSSMRNPQWIIGIDEVGRGPLAGPVGVGAVLVSSDFAWQQLPGVGDSKQLSERQREEVFLQAQELQRAGVVHYSVAQVAAAVIDRVGITAAIATAVQRTVLRLEQYLVTKTDAPVDWQSVAIRLDGGLRAPEFCICQETIIKGDSSEPAIGLASVVAKVTRDRYMTRIAPRTPFTPYGFAAHKGYGTVQHRAAIAQYGLSKEHRVSYCRNINVVV